jgi:hypothetical protein
VHEAIDNGHTWIDAGELVRKANDLLLLDDLDSLDRIKAAGKELVESSDLVAEENAVTLPAIRDDERFIFDTMTQYGRESAHGADPSDVILRGLLPGQREAVRLALAHRIAVITGAAGVGKTLCVSRIASACLDNELCVTVCAPTGKAAKRAEELMQGHGYLSGKCQRHRASQDAWMRKAHSLASSLCIRGKRRVKRKATEKKQPGARRTTWYTACSRMQQQANGRNYRNNRDPWLKWASTVAGNANKRAGGRDG